MKVIIVGSKEEFGTTADLINIPRKGDHLELNGREFEILKVVWNYRNDPNNMKIKINASFKG